MSSKVDELFSAALKAAEKAYAPYSGFPVGAALLAEDGEIYTGANIEIISYPEGWCAETTAISHMIMAGAARVCEVAVYAPKKNMITPCGGCRQRLAEFGSAETLLHLCDAGGIRETISLSTLFPRGFEAEVLKS